MPAAPAAAVAPQHVQLAMVDRAAALNSYHHGSQESSPNCTFLLDWRDDSELFIAGSAGSGAAGDDVDTTWAYLAGGLACSFCGALLNTTGTLFLKRAQQLNAARPSGRRAYECNGVVCSRHWWCGIITMWCAIGFEFWAITLASQVRSQPATPALTSLRRRRNFSRRPSLPCLVRAWLTRLCCCCRVARTVGGGADGGVQHRADDGGRPACAGRVGHPRPLQRRRRHHGPPLPEFPALARKKRLSRANEILLCAG